MDDRARRIRVNCAGACPQNGGSLDAVCIHRLCCRSTPLDCLDVAGLCHRGSRHRLRSRNLYSKLSLAPWPLPAAHSRRRTLFCIPRLFPDIARKLYHYSGLARSRAVRSAKDPVARLALLPASFSAVVIREKSGTESIAAATDACRRSGRRPARSCSTAAGRMAIRGRSNWGTSRAQRARQPVWRRQFFAQQVWTPAFPPALPSRMLELAVAHITLVCNVKSSASERSGLTVFQLRQDAVIGFNRFFRRDHRRPKSAAGIRRRPAGHSGR